VTDVLAAVAAFGAVPSAAPLAGDPLDATAWRVLESRVASERIEGLLAAAVSSGALAVDAGQLASVKQMARGRAKVDVAIEREAIRASAALADAGVEHRLVKGPAVAHRFYPDPSWRGFGDVDIFVDGSAWYRAVSVLEAIGARRPVPELRPGFDSRFGKEATLVADSGVELDLHRTLVVGPYGLWIDARRLLARRPDTMKVGGVVLPVLDASAAFVHACYNAVLADDPPRMIALRDVAQIALSGRFEAEEAVRLASEWRGQAVVAKAVELVQCRLGIDLSATPVGAAIPRRATPLSDRALMWTYRGAGRGYTSQLAGALALRGLADKVAYLSALARPQPSYLRSRGWSPRRYLGHAARKVVGRP
jgi:hypothetical protein